MKQFPTRPRRPLVVEATVDGRRMTMRGRFAWALEQLTTAGRKGCSSFDHSAPRWSHYVFVLRRRGVRIESRMEPHDGAYAGYHARYVLQSRVRLHPARKGG